MAGLSRPVELIDEAPSRLTRHRWVFSLLGNRLQLIRYHYERRRSSRGQFKTTKLYDCDRDPEEDYGDWAWLAEEDVPWDDELKGEALAKLAEFITVCRKSDLA